MNRVRGLERVFYRAAGFVLPDLEPSARSRLELVSLIERLRRVGLPVAVACAVAGVSRASYYRWRYRLRRGGARALTDGRSRNRRRRAAPVRSAVRPLVEELRRERPMGKEKLALTLAAHGVTVSASTVGRCITELVSRGVIEAIGAARRGQRARRLAAARGWARRKRGEKPTQPGELVQLDTLQERTLGEPRYQFTAVDPVTRVAHAQLYKSLTSKSAREFLAELITALPFPLRSVQVDNGSEFKGAFEAACAELGVPLYTIPPRTPKANAKVERLHRTFRDEHYAFEPPTLTIEEQRAALKAYLHHYNHHRPHKALDYQTPAAYAHQRSLPSQMT